jgi:FixJ family two-component response regulator
MPRLPHISIIDDDDALRSSLENLIRSVGLRVQGFSSAESFLSSNQAPETHCLILDVRMPGMSGLELQRQMAVANSLLVIAPITERSILRSDQQRGAGGKLRCVRSKVKDGSGDFFAGSVNAIQGVGPLACHREVGKHWDDQGFRGLNYIRRHK